MMFTKEMIDNYHVKIGEDFIDQNEHKFNGSIIFGYFLAKRPDLASELTINFNENVNEKGIYSVQNIQHLFQDLYDNNDDEFYEILLQYMNVCSDKKKEQILTMLNGYN